MSVRGPRSTGPTGASFVPAEYEWLLLRFEADRRARAPRLHERVVAAAGARAPLRVLDLGAGAGANLLHLAPRLPATDQRWTLVDRDAALVDRVAACFEYMVDPLSERGVSLDRDGDRLRFGDRLVRYRAQVCDFLDQEAPIYRRRWDLIAANAVFDLLSADQFERFLALARTHWRASRPPMYFTINLDRGFEIHPRDDADDAVRALFQAHMQRPQPFGRGLGADSARAMIRLAERAGLAVSEAPSPWQIAAEERAMLRANLDFVDDAVHELIAAGATSLSAETFARWLAERRRQIDRGALTLQVDHRDLWLEWPA